MPKKIGKKSSKNLVQKPGKKFPEMPVRTALSWDSSQNMRTHMNRAGIPIDCRV